MILCQVYDATVTSKIAGCPPSYEPMFIKDVPVVPAYASMMPSFCAPFAHAWTNDVTSNVNVAVPLVGTNVVLTGV